MRSTAQRIRSAALVLTTSLIAPCALGAESPPRAVLEEIVVTAQKREANIQSVPITMQAFTGQQLDDRRVRRMVDVTRLLANANVTIQTPGTEAVNLRGVGTNDAFGNATASVGIYLDEVTLGAPYLSELAIFDVQRVEVLRGPQNSLFGRNTTGGAVSFTSRMPVPGGERDGALSLAYGNHGMVEANAAASFSLSDTFAVRLAGRSFDRDGTFSNLANGGEDIGAFDRKALRGSFVWNATAETTVSGALQWGRERNETPPYRFSGLREADGSANLFSVPDPVTGVVPGPVPAVFGEADFGRISGGHNAAGQVVDTDDWSQVYHVTDDRQDADFLGGHVRVDHEFDAVTLTSITAYTDSSYRFTIDYGGRSGSHGGFILPPVGGPDDIIAVFAQDMEQQAFSQELRLTSPDDGAFRWIAGMLYYSEDARYAQNIGAGPFSFSGQTPPPSIPTVPPFTNAPGFMPPPAQPVGGSLGLLALVGPQSRGYADQAGFSVADLENEMFSPYVHATWEFATDLTLDLGLRYTDDRKSAPSIRAGNIDTSGLARTTFRSREVVEGLALGLPACDLNGDGNPVVRDAATNVVAAPGDDNRGLPCVQQLGRDDLEFEALGGELGLSWQLASDLMVYGTYSRGFRSGKYDIEHFHGPHTGFAITDQDEETLDAFEVGFKSELFDHRLRLNAAAFYYAWNDQQLFLVDPRVGPTFINLDRSELQGLEVEVRWLPAEGWIIDASVGLLDSEVTDEGPDLGNLVEEGHELPFAADFSASAAVAYERHFARGKLSLLVDAQHRSRASTSVFTSPTTDTYDPFTQINARAAWHFGRDGRHVIAAWGENLNDEEYCGFELDLFAFTGAALCMPNVGEPLYGIELSTRF